MRAKKKTRAYNLRKEKQEERERLMFKTSTIVAKKAKVNIVIFSNDNN